MLDLSFVQLREARWRPAALVLFRSVFIGVFPYWSVFGF
jgi:hypothetical protein